MNVHEDAVEKDEKVIIVDELPDLKGRDQIQDCKVYSITQFEGE